MASLLPFIRLRGCGMVCALGFAVAAATGCRTTAGAGSLRADEAVNTVNRVERLVDESNATPEQKAEIKAQLKAVKPVVAQLGRDVDNNQKIADKNQAAANTLRNLAIMSAVFLAGVGAWLYSRRARSAQ